MFTEQQLARTVKHESYRYGIWLDTALAKSNCVAAILKGLVVMFRGKRRNQSHESSISICIFKPIIAMGRNRHNYTAYKTNSTCEY